jgi:uncharacterized OB-fold protein
LPLRERIGSVESLRHWSDAIPLHYEYTGGVAGERFLRGLLEGKILASVCTTCDIAYLPPKMYCTNCFGELDEYKNVGSLGRIAALTETHVDFDGTRLKKARLVGFIEFKGAKGGLIQLIEGKKARIGAAVSARFLPERKRTGALTDIESFVVS